MLIRPRGFGIRKKISNPSIFSIFFKFSNFFLMKKLSCRRSRINKVQNASRKKKKFNLVQKNAPNKIVNVQKSEFTIFNNEFFI